MTKLGSIEDHGVCGDCDQTITGLLPTIGGGEITVTLCMNEKSDHYEHVVSADHLACHEKKE